MNAQKTISLFYARTERSGSCYWGVFTHRRQIASPLVVSLWGIMAEVKARARSGGDE